MSDTLNKKEIKRLIELGKRIQLGLSCDINGQGIPCRTDRLQAVQDMVEYLSIHNIVCDVEGHAPKKITEKIIRQSE